MAYECPVCGVVAPDGEHLAHHLAVVASTRGGDHERWLEEHAPDWAEGGPADLAGTVLRHAESVDHDLADEAADHDHDPLDPPGIPDGVPTDGRPAGRRPPGGGRSDDASAPEAGDDSALEAEETAAVLSEARELTRRMREGADADGEPGTDEPETDTDE